MRAADENVPQHLAQVDSQLQGLAIGESGSNSDGVDGESTKNLFGHDLSSSSGTAVSAKGGKKRLNQAQRRQMSSQLVIPVDTRQVDAPSQPSRGYAGHSHVVHGRGQSYGQGRGHPATFRPGHDRWTSFDAQHSGQAPGIHGSRPQHHRQQGPGYAGQEHQHFQGHRGGYGGQSRPLYQSRPEELMAQAALLDHLCFNVVAGSEIERSEIADKEAFRQRIELISQNVIAQHESEQLGYRGGFPFQSVQLKCFGSLSSGFATKASDMDLGIISPCSTTQPDVPGSPIPRLLEKALLEQGLGARLLTKTRVPIIKLCEAPSPSLHKSLVEERQKWEDSQHETTEEQLSPQGKDSSDAQSEEATKSMTEPPSADREDSQPQAPADEVEPEFYFAVPVETNQTKQLWLKQTRNQSLAAYYGTVKRMLRKVDVRDVTMSNHKDLSEREWVALECMCKGFIQGIADVKLRARLQSAPSLAFSPSPTIPSQQVPGRHCLAAVYAQVEGEQMLQQWEERQSKSVAQEDRRPDGALELWRNLMDVANPGIDPVGFTKELQNTLDRLKKVPWIHLTTLEQLQHEHASQYYARTRSILRGMTIGSTDMGAIISYYISGIQPLHIRKAVQEAAETAVMDFEAVGRQHKALHLAWEFELAVSKQQYDEEHVDAINRYISLLKMPMVNIGADTSVPFWIVPLGTEDVPFITHIRDIKDPHTLAANQPRDRYRDKLEFPKSGVGVQCDINFSAHLALHNTQLLRCYSHTDPRVRPMVLFVKHWAKVRGINSGYRGTLSSYGYVLMVLHYLVNVVKPFVCPNLQQLAPVPPPDASPAEVESMTTCKGYDVRFWRNEEEILHLARNNQLTPNKDTIGRLLRGFFEYYAQNNFMSDGSGRGFDWGRDVLSLRTQGGLLSKQEKGWTGARTTLEGPGQTTTGPVTEVKEVRHRYLFAIEDPFELDHNVARTVTHNGIVSIRDEFRRALKIIRSAGHHGGVTEDLLQDAVAADEDQKSSFLDLIDDIHGLRRP